jgi:hypothetical protein
MLLHYPPGPHQPYLSPRASKVMVSRPNSGLSSAFSLPLNMTVPASHRGTPCDQRRYAPAYTCTRQHDTHALNGAASPGITMGMVARRPRAYVSSCTPGRHDCCRLHDYHGLHCTAHAA